MKKVPILFVSDSISANSGLGRITRDLATRVHEHMGDVYRVGTCGYGGFGSRKFPWPDYHMNSVDNWLLPELPAIWHDFAGEEEGIVFFVWDASRLYWMGRPQTCPIPHLRKWVETAKIKKWIYGAIDAEGPLGQLPSSIAETYKGFDRVLDYSEFSSNITGNPDHLPHGIDTSVFYPRDHKEARQRLIASGFAGLTSYSLLLGIVATNQARKNWQLGFETCKILLDRGHDVRLWCHTDILDRYWSIGNLIVDYGLTGRVAVTTQRFTDEEMTWMYSACDVTLSIAPEGFGFSSAESLACGIPTVCGSYGGQSEFVPTIMQVDPIAYHYEGAYCSKRPVHDPQKWADTVLEVSEPCGAHDGGGEDAGCNCTECPLRLDWNNYTLLPLWQEWFLKGIA